MRVDDHKGVRVMSARRVVITGLGAVTPVANTMPETWRALKEGRSGIAPITIFDAGTFPTRIAGEVKNFEMAKWPKQIGATDRLGRNSHFALEASVEALRQAGLERPAGDPERFGI